MLGLRQACKIAHAPGRDPPGNLDIEGDRLISDINVPYSLHDEHKEYLIIRRDSMHIAEHGSIKFPHS